MNKRSGFQSSPIPKTDWCPGLMIRNIIKSERHRLKHSLLKIKNKNHILPLSYKLSFPLNSTLQPNKDKVLGEYEQKERKIYNIINFYHFLSLQTFKFNRLFFWLIMEGIIWKGRGKETLFFLYFILFFIFRLFEW